ncbi:MAG: hypothetical protein ACR5K4_01160 [Sodalis sp. (in: enterobacteria)]
MNINNYPAPPGLAVRVLPCGPKSRSCIGRRLNILTLQALENMGGHTPDYVVLIAREIQLLGLYPALNIQRCI